MTRDRDVEGAAHAAAQRLPPVWIRRRAGRDEGGGTAGVSGANGRTHVARVLDVDQTHDELRAARQRILNSHGRPFGKGHDAGRSADRAQCRHHR